jgi:Asp/Glu/hydantoin racemase
VSKRIILVHAYRHSMPPIDAAFRSLWPEAETLNLLDEGLYADVSAEGVVGPTVQARVRSLLAYCVQSAADGVVFTGSTFGPMIDAARQGISIPVLKADEAMAAVAVRRGGRILLVCTARRAIPVISANFHAAAAAAGVVIDFTAIVVPDAKDAISRGDLDLHDRLVADAIALAPPVDTIVFGQISMTNVRDRLAPSLAAKVLTSSEASVERLREIMEQA